MKGSKWFQHLTGENETTDKGSLKCPLQARWHFYVDLPFYYCLLTFRAHETENTWREGKSQTSKKKKSGKCLSLSEFLALKENAACWPDCLFALLRIWIIRRHVIIIISPEITKDGRLSKHPRVLLLKLTKLKDAEQFFLKVNSIFVCLQVYIAAAQKKVKKVGNII